MEKVTNKQAIEVLGELKHNILEDLTNPAYRDLLKNYLQAIDHAINCVGATEQIKWERDIAIQQLNELGYQFGEKIRSDEE